jgi:MFS family permease
MLLPAAVVQLGSTAFWSSYSPMIAAISEPEERERWFGFLGALRNGSFAVGGLVAAAVVTAGSDLAYTGVVLANAASSLVAFVLLLKVHTIGTRLPVESPATAGRRTSSRTGWGQVVRDRPYLLLVVTNFTYAMSGMTLNVAIPVYLTRTLGLPGWLAGAVFTINTIMIGLGQGLVVNAIGGSVRANVVALGSLFAGASYLVLLSADWLPVTAGVLVALLASVVFTGGELVSGPVISTLATDAAPSNLRGRYISVYQLSWTVAGTVAPVSLLWLLSQGAAALWLALVGVAIAGVLLAGALRRVMPLADARVPRAVGAVSTPVPTAG